MSKRFAISLILPLLLASLTASCCKDRVCPKPVQPAPRTVIAEPLECKLPSLPLPLTKPVGFPSPDGAQIFVSLTDWATLGAYVLGLHQWIEAAAPCIEGK